MEYGIRLFRHVVAQVFGNLAQAARITGLPFVIFGGVAYLLVGDFILFMSQFDHTGVVPTDRIVEHFGSEEAFLTQALTAFLLVFAGLVVFAWVAVAWHRYVLVEEYSTLLPEFSGRRVLGYLGRSILVALVLLLAMIPAVIVFGLFAGLAQQSGGGFGILFLIGMGVSFFASWVLVRFSLILPAGAVDHKMTIGESWTVTSKVSGEILVPILGFALIFTVLQRLLAATVTGAEPGTMMLVMIVASAFVYWIQMLVNLALLTTLYGTLVQGRDLN